MAITMPNWVVQIFFGRYRSWGSMTWTHLIIFASTMTIMLYVYLLILRRRFRYFRKQRQAIPTTTLRLLRPHVSRRAEGLIIATLAENIRLQRTPVRSQWNDPEIVDCGDPQWLPKRKLSPETDDPRSTLGRSGAGGGGSGGKLQFFPTARHRRQFSGGIFGGGGGGGDPKWEDRFLLKDSPPSADLGGWNRFTTRRSGPDGLEQKTEDVDVRKFIGTSYHVLQNAAVSRRPGLTHTNSRSIRDYVATLHRAFPGVDGALLEKYLTMYEAAVFSGPNRRMFTASDYYRFVSILEQLEEMISSNHWNSR